MTNTATIEEVQENSPKLEILDMEQGSPEWHALRKTKITATDASVIMRASHWKTRIQLYHEKLSNDPPFPPNERMQRGIDLEPIARELFNLKTTWYMEPTVLVKDWMMASLDGRDALSGAILEIKCPAEKDHVIALYDNKVPDHYYPQLQHQIYVSGVMMAYYFSFDGMDGVIVEVKRDNDYIEKMLIEEKKFYECLINKTPPEPDESDYIEREDDLWRQCAMKWKLVTTSIKELEKEEEDLRKQLVFLSGESNSKGAGISLCQVIRKGIINYSKIECLKNMDLEIYRNPSSSSWRITHGK
jgi:putative phage-type endonuclease